MQDVIHKLRRKNQMVPVPLDLPDEDQLLDIEEALLISLPRDYRDFLLQVSDLVVGSVEPATAADPNSHTYLADIIAEAWNRGVPRDQIPFCEHQGSYYCLDMEERVQQWKGQGFTGEEWSSIWDWAEDVWLASAKN